MFTTKPIRIKFSRCQYMPKTLMQKNNIGILGNDMRINKNNAWVDILGSAGKTYFGI